MPANKPTPYPKQKRRTSRVGFAKKISTKALLLRQTLESELMRELPSFQEYLRQHALSESSLLATWESKQHDLFWQHHPLLKLYFDLRSQNLPFDKPTLRKADGRYSTFADTSAQAIAYGLLTARWMSKKEDSAPSSIRSVLSWIPSVLKGTFAKMLDLRGSALVNHQMEDLYREIAQAKIHDIFDHSAPDPITHFYEDFLAAYEQKTRKARGVYYTPPDAVNFIVRSIDEQLQSAFGLPLGLASTQTWKQVSERLSCKVPTIAQEEDCFIRILDPAAGTGTFIKSIIEQIRNKLRHHWKQQGWSKEKMTREWGAYLSGKKGDEKDYTNNGLLSRINAFEIMAAPYMIAHLRIAWLLRDDPDMPFLFEEADRLNLFLTNALECNRDRSNKGREDQHANIIKRDTAITIVLGNPPYAGASQNNHKYIRSLMDTYKTEPGGKQKLRERNPKWLNDDYVKFIRMGQDYIERANIGILAYINPHGFLDNPTFRGMRWSLWTTFDTLFVLDLHGNHRKKEAVTDGSKDENIFQIMQGIAINVFLKTKETNRTYGTLYHHELYGSAKKKCRTLTTSLHRLPFKRLPTLEQHFNYFFMVPKDASVLSSYIQGFIITELFKKYSVGIVTARDRFLIDQSKTKLSTRIKDFLKCSVTERNDRYGHLENKTWNNEDIVHRARPFSDKRIIRIAYRPFDHRYLYYDDDFVERPRREVMQHCIQKENIGLMLNKKIEVGKFHHAFLYSAPTESHALSLKEINYLFPLYTYENQRRTENIFRLIPTKIQKDLQLTKPPSGEELLHYIYAILHHRTYRTNFYDFLIIDYPRIPYPKDRDTFQQLIEKGRSLRQIHLFESAWFKDLPSLLKNDDGTVAQTSQQITGLKHSQKIMPNETVQTQRVYINRSQYFDGISDLVWNFYIGGYKPAQKWLKDRKGQTLSSAEILHYTKIIKAIEETDRIMTEIEGFEVSC